MNTLDYDAVDYVIDRLESLPERDLNPREEHEPPEAFLTLTEEEQRSEMRAFLKDKKCNPELARDVLVCAPPDELDKMIEASMSGEAFHADQWLQQILSKGLAEYVEAMRQERDAMVYASRAEAL